MTDFVNPYKFDESLRDHPIKCENNFHPSRMVKEEGPLWIEICLDPRCAKVTAKCEHQLPVAKEDGYVKSINIWNDEGTILTCQYCGADVT